MTSPRGQSGLQREGGCIESIRSGIIVDHARERAVSGEHGASSDPSAIPGFYASGQSMGLYYGNYTGATSVLKGAVFGRIAGKDAAERSRANATRPDELATAR